MANEVLDIISDEAKLGIKGWVSTTDDKTATSRYDSLRTIDLPPEKQREIAIEILSSDPYTQEYYLTFLKKFGFLDQVQKSGILSQEGKEILAIAEYFGSDYLAREEYERLDTEYRTVEGVVLASKESADAARADLKKYDDILENPKYVFRRDYLEYNEKVKGLPIDENLKSVYINRCNDSLSVFDKKCKKAARHEYRTKNKSHFWNGDATDMLIHIAAIAIVAIILTINAVNSAGTEGNTPFIIMGMLVWLGAGAGYLFVFKPKGENKVWDEVTHNGKYTFEDIIS